MVARKIATRFNRRSNEKKFFIEILKRNINSNSTSVFVWLFLDCVEDQTTCVDNEISSNRWKTYLSSDTDVFCLSVLIEFEVTRVLIWWSSSIHFLSSVIKGNRGEDGQIFLFFRVSVMKMTTMCLLIVPRDSLVSCVRTNRKTYEQWSRKQY